MCDDALTELRMIGSAGLPGVLPAVPKLPAENTCQQATHQAQDWHRGARGRAILALYHTMHALPRDKVSSRDRLCLPCDVDTKRFHVTLGCPLPPCGYTTYACRVPA